MWSHLKSKAYGITKLIKSSRPNHTAISWKTNPNRYALVLIMRKLIPIGSVTNLRKNRADRTVHTPCELRSEDIDQLILPVNDSEIFSTLKSLKPYKAPGPDKLHAGFLQRF